MSNAKPTFFIGYSAKDPDHEPRARSYVAPSNFEHEKKLSALLAEPSVPAVAAPPMSNLIDSRANRTSTSWQDCQIM